MTDAREAPTDGLPEASVPVTLAERMAVASVRTLETTQEIRSELAKAREDLADIRTQIERYHSEAKPALDSYMRFLSGLETAHTQAIAGAAEAKTRAETNVVALLSSRPAMAVYAAILAGLAAWVGRWSGAPPASP